MMAKKNLITVFFVGVFSLLTYLVPINAFACTEIRNEDMCSVNDPVQGCYGPSDIGTKRFYGENSEASPGYTCAGGWYPFHRREWECSFSEDSPCSSSCFLPGTQISTPNGKRNIEDLKPGDKVLSFDEKTKQLVENTVKQSTVSSVNEYYVITTESGEQVKVTGEHPFFTGDLNQPPSKPLTRKEKLLDFITNFPYYFRLGWKETFGF